METKEIKTRKKKLELDIQQLIDEFEKEVEILKVDKVYVSDKIVRTELKVTILNEVTNAVAVALNSSTRQLTEAAGAK